jgi:hypothetical protein
LPSALQRRVWLRFRSNARLSRGVPIIEDQRPSTKSASTFQLQQGANLKKTPGMMTFVKSTTKLTENSLKKRITNFYNICINLSMTLKDPELWLHRISIPIHIKQHLFIA